MKNIAIIGATGSIGMQSLEVLNQYGNQFSVEVLTGYENEEQLKQLSQQYPQAKTWNKNNPTEKLKELIQADYIDIVLIAISGKQSEEVCTWAVEAGKDIIIASKEAILRGGTQLIKTIQEKAIQCYSIDSEMVALSQLLNKSRHETIDHLTITCSGGPFLGYTEAKLRNVSAEMALKHPRWSMGKKISIESALWLNKGYEIIEAHLLFGLPIEKINVLVHPESYVHGILTNSDGTQIQQLSFNDMKVPINYIIGQFAEKHEHMPQLGLKNQSLNFFDPEKFYQIKGINVVLDAYHHGILNEFMDCADQLIEKFLNKKVSFLEIYAQLELFISSKKKATIPRKNYSFTTQ